MTRDPRIDAYIGSRQPFARPILEHLRARVAAACPQAQETIRWSSPAWTYKGQLLCSMAAFKAHASFGFWRGSEVAGIDDRAREGMGQFGRIQSLADLPDDATLDALIAKAASLVDSGARVPREPKHGRPAVEEHPLFRAALDANPEAAAHFQAFPPSYRRDYWEWIAEAKRGETRNRRIAQAIEWIAGGKGRNWKYQR